MDLKIRPIKNNVFYIGSKDANRKLFDQLVPLPQGTTYNSYLVKGSEKTAIVDTDYPKKLEEYKHVKYANYPAGSACLWQKAGHEIVVRAQASRARPFGVLG